MKYLRFNFYLAVFMLLAVQIFAQSELLVPPFSGANYLNSVIAGDTTAAGARVDTNRVYVLQRGGVYFVNSPITNKGYTLRVKAQEATGRRPVIFLVKNTSTSSNPGYFLQAGGNVNLKSVLITGILESDTASFSLMQGGLINLSTAGWRIVIDDCILSNVNGNHIRTDQAAKALYITNTMFTNMGYLGRSNLGAGKALDLRAGSCDSVIIMNCSFVNGQDRIIRHFTSTAAINNLIFDHNTVVNNMSYHGVLSLGIVGKKVKITNNLFMDAFALGNDTDATRQAEFNESGETDEFGRRRMSWIFSVNNDSTWWIIKNNHYVVSDSGQAFYNRHAAAGVKGEGAILSWHINKRLGADSVNAFKKVSLTLSNSPKVMTTMMDWYRRPVAQGGAGKTKATTNFSRLLHDYDRRTIFYSSDTMNLSYATTHATYTASEGGFPLGDLNWFPTKKSDWATWYAVNDVQKDDVVPAQFTLLQNYPNPFNPSTKIAFTLQNQTKASVTIFNALGQQITTLVNGELAAGLHEYEFNAAGLASGMYFYRLEAGSFSQVRKMVILK